MKIKKKTGMCQTILSKKDSKEYFKISVFEISRVNYIADGHGR